MKNLNVLGNICVINAGLTHTVPRTLVMQPYCNHIYYIDVTGKVDSRAVETGNVSFLRLPAGGLRSRYAALKKIFTKTRPDYIIHHYISGDLLGLVQQAATCPVIGIAMGSDVLDLGQPRKRRRNRLWWRQLSFIAAKSERLRHALQQEGVTKPVMVNYWGCNPPGKDDRRPKADLRRAIGVPPDCRLLLSMRGIAPCYNIKTIIAAFRLLVDRERGDSPPWHLLLTGRSHDNYAEFRQEVEEQIRALKLCDRISVRLDLPQFDMVRIIGAADASISLAASEGMPNSMFECWAMRVPVVMGDIPELHEQVETGELIRDGENAYFCSFTPESAAENLERAVTDPHANRVLDAAEADFNRFGNLETNAAGFAAAIKQLPPYRRKQLSYRFNLAWCALGKLCDRLSRRTMPS